MNDSQPRQPNHQRLLEKAMAHTAVGREAAAGCSAPSIEELASHFPDYQILEQVGRGGMGTVFKAVQSNLQRTVAIKVLATELAQDPEFGERFLREARTLATLNHPGILTVHDYGERNGVFFLVTEFVEGVNLRQLMELGELSPAEALRIAPQLCTALQYAHERGVVHRDIKPENILIDTRGEVKVADFGLAKVSRPGDAVGLTRNTAVFGTPHYMAPEQFQGARLVDHRADIYSLGVVLYEMLTGNLPIGNFDPPSQRGGVPHGLDAVVRRALAQQPNNRYQRARDVGTDVEQEATQLRNHAPLACDPAKKPYGRIVKAPLFALVTLVLVAVALSLLWFVRDQAERNQQQYATDLAQYQQAIAEAAEQVRAEQSMTATAALPAPPTPAWISAAATSWIAAGLALGAVLLLLGCGFGAIRTIRNSNGTRTGMGFAVFTAWMIPLVLIGTLAGAPAGYIPDPNLRPMVALILVPLAVFAGLNMLGNEVLRQGRLLQAGVAMRGGKGWQSLAVVLAIAAFAGAGLAPLYTHSATAIVSPTKQPLFAKDLLGRSRSEVLALVGPPVNVSASAGSQTWRYQNELEQTRDALVFADDDVVAIEPGMNVVLPNIVDESIPHAGQLMGDFVQYYGAPSKRTVGTTMTEFLFDNGMTVYVQRGIVLGVQGR